MDNKENNSPLSGERVEDYRGLTEQEILNLPKNDNKELFLIHRMPEGYNPVRDRKTIMFLEAMFRDGYDIGSSWQENKDTARISELESENAKLREALGSLKQFLYNEIIERRNYSASKSFEIVLEQIEIAEQSINSNEK